MKQTNKQAGFTLVELAIVMVIIGLLIGGILKGQELIRNAAVSSTAAQLKAFESAYITFIDIYKQKPGDLSTARLEINGCNGNASCLNGNGNGVIVNLNSIVTNRLGQTNDEGFQALKHLALANLIGGVESRSPASDTNPEGLVQSDLNGYLYLGESRGNLAGGWSGNVQLPSGILVGQTPAANTWAANTRGAMSTDVARLDAKIDDGAPRSGVLRLTGATTCFRGNDYRLNEDINGCNFVHKIN